MSDSENEVVDEVEQVDEYAGLSAKKTRKHKYRARLEKYLDEYKNILVIQVDYVGSSQMQQVRMALRGDAVILMGKNTIMRKVLRDAAVKNPKLELLLPLVKGNIGFVFTNGNLPEIRKTIVSNQVPAAAKTGVLAPSDVYVPPGPTGLDPGQTNFFQALNIATKISRGAIEIVSKVHLIHEGDKVTSSAVALLSKLGIKPFFFGIKVSTVYENGSLYDAKVLDITDADMMTKFFAGVRTIAALGLEIGYPTLCSIPHSFTNAFKKLLSIALATEYTFEAAQSYKDLLSDPEALAKLQAAQAAAAGGAAKDEDGDKEEEDESSSDDDDDDGEGFDLFD